MDRTRRAATIALLLGLVASARVRAETESIRLTYRADPACPSEERFVSQVLRRASNARLAATSEAAARTFVVTIEPGRGGFSGSLVIEENGARSLARQVSASNCNDLANALALSTALAIDPSANLTAEPEPNPSASASAPPNKPATSAKDGANTNGKHEQRGQSAKPASDANPQYHDIYEDDYGPGARARSGHDAWSTVAGLGFSLRAAYSPRLALGGALALRRENNSDGQPISSFGGELAYLQSLTAQRDGATASMQFFLLRPELCGFAIHPTKTVRVEPCASAELGLLRGSGSNIPQPYTKLRFWGALGLWLRLEFDLSQQVLLQLAAGPSFPLTRYKFEFEQPDVTIYDVPVVGLAAHLQLGIRL